MKKIEYIEYMPSEGVCALTDRNGTDELVRKAMTRFFEREIIWNPGDFFCSRILAINANNEQKVIVFLMFEEEGKVRRHLLTWDEAKTSGLAEKLSEFLSDKNEGYEALNVDKLPPDVKNA